MRRTNQAAAALPAAAAPAARAKCSTSRALATSRWPTSRAWAEPAAHAALLRRSSSPRASASGARCRWAGAGLDMPS